MTDTLTAMDTALRTALAAHSALAALTNGQIYEGQAPAEAVYPFVLFSCVAGGDQELAPTRDVSLLYQVECWSESAGVSAQVAGYIDEALHRATLEAAGWSVYHCKRAGVIRLTDLVQGRQYEARGGEYRIRADET